MSYFNYQPKRIFIKRQAMENHLGLGMVNQSER